jgi:GT2 family glycosyltransferase
MISVVIVTYNSEACLAACMDALARSLPDAEILVIDNASTDASRSIAEDHGATVVALRKNIGFGRACNVGAHRAQHDHILFLNPDVTIRSADESELHKLLGVDHLGLVVPASTNNEFTFTERSWAWEALELTLGGLWPRELSRPAISRRSDQAVWASGAMLLVRASEFRRIGGFDPRYFMYYEDRDLSWRYRNCGLPVRTTTALAADHSWHRSSDVSDRGSDIIAYAMMSWLQYTHGVRGPEAAARAWTVARRTHTAITGLVNLTSRVVPSARLRRKSLQLSEVSQELSCIRARAGTLEQSDTRKYWPDAVALLSAVS